MGFLRFCTSCRHLRRHRGVARVAVRNARAGVGGIVGGLLGISLVVMFDATKGGKEKPTSEADVRAEEIKARREKYNSYLARADRARSLKPKPSKKDQAILGYTVIDLRKPLEGTPGLLLMAALVLFGATIGIAFAIGFTWIPISDALANFLGGIVGAGLGAALAIGGAVYVQRLDKQDQLTAPLNSLRSAIKSLERLLRLLNFVIEPEPGTIFPVGVRQPEIALGLIAQIQGALAEFPSGAEISESVSSKIDVMKEKLNVVLEAAQESLWRHSPPSPLISPVSHFIELSIVQLGDLVRSLDRLDRRSPGL